MADGKTPVGLGLPLRVSGLTVRRPDGTTILENAAFRVDPGVALGLSGPSGAGKSTLLLAIAGLLDRVSGEVRWGDTEILSLGREARARFRAENLGIVFQDFLLFDELDALGNAALAAMFRPRHARSAISDRAQATLTSLGLPQGHRRVDTFSGGERQRVAVARALAANPPILLADEPTASLDRTAADRLVDDLTAMVRRDQRTMIAVSHDHHLLDRMDRVLTILDGQLSDGH